VDGERKGNGTATDVKILRNGFKEDAEGIDRHCWFAKEKTDGRYDDHPPAIEDTVARFVHRVPWNHNADGERVSALEISIGVMLFRVEFGLGDGCGDGFASDDAAYV